MADCWVVIFKRVEPGESIGDLGPGPDLESPAGWGGRETVGGSPRGLALTESQAREAFATVCLSVRKGAL